MTGINSLMGVGDGRFDGHAHVFLADLPLADGRRYAPAADAPFDTYCDLLRANDLAGGLLLQTSFLGTDNSFMLDILKQGKELPDLTFRGVAVVEPDIGADELKRLGEAGIVGIRLNLFGKQHPLDIDQWSPLLKQVDSLGWHVDLHCEGEHVEKIGTVILQHCENAGRGSFWIVASKKPAQCRRPQLASGNNVRADICQSVSTLSGFPGEQFKRGRRPLRTHVQKTLRSLWAGTFVVGQ